MKSTCQARKCCGLNSIKDEFQHFLILDVVHDWRKDGDEIFNIAVGYGECAIDGTEDVFE